MIDEKMLLQKQRMLEQEEKNIRLRIQGWENKSS
jgi:hypothetical protein